MRKKKEVKGAKFQRLSVFNKNRDSYLSKDFEYVYITKEYVDGKYVDKKIVIPYTEETKDVIIVLDKLDHEEDLQDRYENENRYNFIENDERQVSIEDVEDTTQDIYSKFMAKEENTKRFDEFMDTLTDTQKTLYETMHLWVCSLKR